MINWLEFALHHPPTRLKRVARDFNVGVHLICMICRRIGRMMRMVKIFALDLIICFVVSWDVLVMVTNRFHVVKVLVFVELCLKTYTVVVLDIVDCAKLTWGSFIGVGVGDIVTDDVVIPLFSLIIHVC